MTANDNALPERVQRLEGVVAAMADDLADVRTGQGKVETKVDQIFELLSSTDNRAAERAQTVKIEMREETQRKQAERSDLIKNCCIVLGAIVAVVAGLGRPYATQLEATSSALGETTRAVAQVRELIAADHAEITRNHDSIEIAREKNRVQDDRLFDLSQRLARAEGR